MNFFFQLIEEFLPTKPFYLSVRQSGDSKMRVIDHKYFNASILVEELEEGVPEFVWLNNSDYIYGRLIKRYQSVENPFAWVVIFAPEKEIFIVGESILGRFEEVVEQSDDIRGTHRLVISLTKQMVKRLLREAAA